MCEDYPCCGHTRLDPCPGDAVVMSHGEWQEAYWCDQCGFSHQGDCPDDLDDLDEDER